MKSHLPDDPLGELSDAELIAQARNHVSSAWDIGSAQEGDDTYAYSLQLRYPQFRGLYTLRWIRAGQLDDITGRKVDILDISPVRVDDLYPECADLTAAAHAVYRSVIWGDDSALRARPAMTFDEIIETFGYTSQWWEYGVTHDPVLRQNQPGTWDRAIVTSRHRALTHGRRRTLG